MPISMALGKPLIGAVLARLSARGLARRVVDMGPGAGTYADLFRALTPEATWCAVEAWGPYVEKYGLRDKYDEIIIADIRYLDFVKLGPSDVALFGDILEHMSVAEARDVLAHAAMKSRFMALSIPIGHWPQDEIEGNPFEKHVEDNLSHSEIQDIVPNLCGGQAMINNQGQGLGVYFSATDLADRSILTSIVAEAEDLIAGTASDDLNVVAVDFLDPLATAAFRDRIAASVMI